LSIHAERKDQIDIACSICCVRFCTGEKNITMTLPYFLPNSIYVLVRIDGVARIFQDPYVWPPFLLGDLRKSIASERLATQRH
jgi:hypothetical protein